MVSNPSIQVKAQEIYKLAGTISFKTHSGSSFIKDSPIWFLDSALEKNCSEDHSGSRILYNTHKLLVCALGYLTSFLSVPECAAKYWFSEEALGSCLTNHYPTIR